MFWLRERVPKAVLNGLRLGAASNRESEFLEDVDTMFVIMQDQRIPALLRPTSSHLDIFASMSGQLSLYGTNW